MSSVWTISAIRRTVFEEQYGVDVTATTPWFTYNHRALFNSEEHRAIPPELKVRRLQTVHDGTCSPRDSRRVTDLSLLLGVACADLRVYLFKVSKSPKKTHRWQ